MMIFVIVASWNEVLYKLDAWSDNYYLAHVYYNQLSKKKENIFLTSYEVDKSFGYLKLLEQLKKEFDTSIDDFIGSKLNLKSSEDGNLCAIFKEKYADSFNATYENGVDTLYKEMIDLFSGICLSTVPLVRYMNDGDLLFTLLFSIYKKATLDNYIVLDMVYFWYLFLKVNCVNIISSFHRDCIPEDTVFIRVDEY